MAWLANEHAAAAIELNIGLPAPDYGSWAYRRVRAPLHLFSKADDIERSVLSTPPSSRGGTRLERGRLRLGSCVDPLPTELPPPVTRRRTWKRAISSALLTFVARHAMKLANIYIDAADGIEAPF